MIERIYAYLCLLCAGMIGESAYHEALDELFLQNPESELLMELEFLSGDAEKSWTFFHQYCVGDNQISYDYLLFGKILFSYLETIYRSNRMGLKEFGKKAYEIWGLLPIHIYESDMFWVLDHADDDLSSGDEQSARELYERAFAYYRNAEQKYW